MPEPAELLYLAAGLGAGGTERHLARLLPALPADRFRPRVWDAGEQGESESVLTASGISVEHFEPPVSVRDVGALTRMVTTLSRRSPAFAQVYSAMRGGAPRRKTASRRSSTTSPASATACSGRASAAPKQKQKRPSGARWRAAIRQ